MDTHFRGPATNGHGAVPTMRALQTAISRASGLLTGTNAANATTTKIVTIGSRVYRLKSTPVALVGDVLIAGTADGTLANLVNAINNSGGTAGTDYLVLSAHPDVTAVVGSVAHTVRVIAKVDGVAANAIVTTTDEPTYSWGAGTLAGGRNNSIVTTPAGVAFGFSNTTLARVLLRTVGASFLNPLIVEMIEFAETAFNGTGPVVSIVSYLVTDTAFATPTVEFAIADISGGIFKYKCITADRIYRVEYTAPTGNPTAGNIYSFARVSGPGYTS